MCLFLKFFFWGFETTDTLKGDLNLNLIYIQFSQQSFFSLRHRKRIKKRQKLSQADKADAYSHAYDWCHIHLTQN